MTSRVYKGVRIDPHEVDLARERAGLPPETDLSAVIRYAVARLAGTDPSHALIGRKTKAHRDAA